MQIREGLELYTATPLLSNDFIRLYNSFYRGDYSQLNDFILTFIMQKATK